MEHAPSAPAPSRAEAQRQTLFQTWLILIGFFLISLTLVAFGSWSIWRFYNDATLVQSSRLIARDSNEWLTWRPCGRIPFQRASDQQLLRPCDAVRISDNAIYGQAATIELFDRSTIDLWAGTTLAFIEAERSRWTDQVQRVVFEQSSGYIRYDLRADQPFNQVVYHVQIGSNLVELAPGGSYSIAVQPSGRVNRILNGNERRFAIETISDQQVDIAVRSGSARVLGGPSEAIRFVAGQRVQIDPTGRVSLPIPARWDLLRDGDFNRFSEQAYNNTTLVDLSAVERADTWQVYGIGAASVANGYFRIAPTCAPPETGFACDPIARRTAAWFYRAGNQTTSFITGIQQGLGPGGNGADVSEYRHLRLSAWVRVLGQSLALTGEQGTECPIMIRVLARRNAPSDEPHERVFCAYSTVATDGEPVRWPGVTYQSVEPFVWQRIELDLREAAWFPDYRFLESLQIYASGHDYNAQLSGLSLVGEQ